MSDIKFDGEWVVVEGNWTRVRTLDLMLDAPARRQSNSGWRRALVHNHQDGLTINYASDYPGGVTINGDVKVPTKLTVAGRDVAALLASLQAEVQTLKAKVAALEAKP